MGNINNLQQFNDFYVHSCLGQIKRIQSEDGPQLLEFPVFVQSENIIEQWIGATSSFSDHQLDQILFMPRTHCFQRIGFCSRMGEVTLIFDDFMFSLSDEIEDRNKISRHFPQQTALHFLFNLIRAEDKLGALHLTIGDVRPCNILVNQDGQWRIISKHSWPKFSNERENRKEEERFVSPEELKSGNEFQFDLNVSEVFSIGMTMLQICTLKPSKDIYSNNGIQLKLLAQRVQMISKYYSQPFSKLISQMLTVNHKVRITSSEVLQILSKYSNDIFGFKKVVFQDTQTKFKKQSCPSKIKITRYSQKLRAKNEELLLGEYQSLSFDKRKTLSLSQDD